MYAIMGNPLKKIILLSLILYTPLCYDLFTQPIREAPLFSMTSRKMQEWESNQKPYISHKSTKPQVPQEGVQHSHPSLIESAPVLWALGFETLVKEVPHKSQELQINLPSQIPGAPYRSALFFWWLQQIAPEWNRLLPFHKQFSKSRDLIQIRMLCLSVKCASNKLSLRRHTMSICCAAAWPRPELLPTF